ncbi:DUF5320 domain-containing protein [Candidatus Woesearchaeota archaeon]|nr:DUF5320 domain-containing protein [Nanoarchaeota archaeon]MCB9370535.1 DUF5320 domain-containing protein [Candidatus Woesearchaeota archaeon]USN43611.1 MAG: DUF5320 domain-containing protein [Candidatus Woesearchaeota archaeon]
MPQHDKTGPQGQGAKTGKQKGCCEGKEEHSGECCRKENKHCCCKEGEHKHECRRQTNTY